MKLVTVPVLSRLLDERGMSACCWKKEELEWWLVVVGCGACMECVRGMVEVTKSIISSDESCGRSESLSSEGDEVDRC